MPLRALIWAAVSSQPQLDNVSLEEQERAAREQCQREGWQVIEPPLRVPGYSRSESDVITAMEDFAAQGIFAYHDLRKHWQVKDFDVLVAFDHSRLARSQPLHAQVVVNVIESGAIIHFIQGGRIDAESVEFQTALGGISATAGVKRLVKMRHAAMDKRAASGLPTTNRHNPAYTVIRDERGKAVKLVLDESKRRIWDNLATLLLEGVSYNDLETQMYGRFGHVNEKTGRPHHHNYYYRLLHTASFWGHSIRHAPNHMDASGWTYDVDITVPGGTKCWRNTHEPVYSGQQGEQIRAELRRRREIIRGQARPHNTRSFSGLCICSGCGYTLSANPGTDYKNHPHPLYWICQRNRPSYHRTTPCPAPHNIRDEVLHSYIDDLLRTLLARTDPDSFFEAFRTGPDVASQIAQVQRDIAEAEETARRTNARLNDPRFDQLQDMLMADLVAANDRLKILRGNLADLKSRPESADVSQSRKRAIEEIRALGLKKFWQQDSRYINQTLHQVLGTFRLRVKDHQVEDIVERTR